MRIVVLTNVASNLLSCGAGTSLPSESCNASACAATRLAVDTACDTPETLLSLMQDSFTYNKKFITTFYTCA